MSVLIGKRQLIGAARINRESVPNGDHRVPGSHRSHGMAVKNEYLTYEDTYKGILTTKITSVCDVLPYFRHFCHVS